jgi:2',3'-cyclic-nucleotide 2'-phosphodiesterase (5'-nucleotidase family)
MIDIMNRCGFAVSAIGNHEFDMGQESLARRIAQAEFPFISCNIDATKAVINQPKPYIILEVGEDAKIAVLSAVQLNENGIPDSHPSNLKGLRFINGLTKMKEYSDLKQKYGILIGLTHLGVDDDIRLADSMPELDVILGGHSHTLLEKPLMENGVMICQASAHMKYVGKLTLTIENGQVKGCEDEVIAVSSLTREDTLIRALITKYNANEEFNRVVAVAEAPIDGLDELGSLMADAVTSELKLDIALQNKGGIRLWSLPQGDITMKNIYQLDPFGNQVVVMRMNAAEIRSLLCYGFNLEKGIDFQVSGMTYKVTPDGNNKCVDVDMFDLTGKPLDPAKEYSVGLSTYVAVTYKFDHRDPGKTLYTTTSQALMDYLHKTKKVNYTGVKRALER